MQKLTKNKKDLNELLLLLKSKRMYTLKKKECIHYATFCIKKIIYIIHINIYIFANFCKKKHSKN